jgi:hypothetical protein
MRVCYLYGLFAIPVPIQRAHLLDDAILMVSESAHTCSAYLQAYTGHSGAISAPAPKRGKRTA